MSNTNNSTSCNIVDLNEDQQISATELSIGELTVVPIVESNVTNERPGVEEDEEETQKSEFKRNRSRPLSYAEDEDEDEDVDEEELPSNEESSDQDDDNYDDEKGDDASDSEYKRRMRRKVEEITSKFETKRFALVRKEKGFPKIFIRDPSNIDPKICIAQCTNGIACQMAKIVGNFCNVHHRINELRTPDLRCLCLNLNSGEECNTNALKGLPEQMCSRHFSDRKIKIQQDPEERARLCLLRDLAIKKAQSARLELLHLHEAERIQAAQKKLPEVSEAELFAPIRKKPFW